MEKYYSAACEKVDIISVIQQKNYDEHLVEMCKLELEEKKLLLEERRLTMEEKKLLRAHPTFQPIPMAHELQFKTIDQAELDQLTSASTQF